MIGEAVKIKGSRRRAGRTRRWRGLGAALLVLGAGARAHAAEPLVVPAGLRLLVVAPHPDDESLAAGGLIQRTLAQGGRVHVVFMTNGDGYPEAVAAATGRAHPTPGDYRRFGGLRRAEALVAVAHYGLAPAAVSFLGFPDGGLAELWRRGARAAPYESPYTREARPPYPEAFDVGARYVRDDLVRALARVTMLAAPDWIVVPTPLDSHGDHCATFAFVLAALRPPAGGSAPAVKRPERVLTYLVHVGDWPPPASKPGPLPEPPAIFAPARWYSLVLTPGEVATKLAALESHRTQAAVMDGLFRAFDRSNELFGVIDRDALAPLDPDTVSCEPDLYSSAPQAPADVSR